MKINYSYIYIYIQQQKKIKIDEKVSIWNIKGSI